MMRFPIAFSLALVLIVITEVGIAHRYQFSTEDNILGKMIASKKTIAQDSTQNFDVLLFGDSTCAYAFDPKKLESEIGRPVFSFATVGDASMTTNFFYLKEYLKHHAPPKQIVLMLSFESWPRGLDGRGVASILFRNFRERLWPTILSLEKGKRFSKSFAVTMQFLLPSGAYRSEIKNDLAHLAGVGSSSMASQTSNEVIRNRLIQSHGNYRELIDEERGVERTEQLINKERKRYEETRNQPRVLSEPRLTSDALIKDRYYVSHLNQVYLKRFLVEAKRHGIQVIWAYPTVSAEQNYGPSNNQIISSYLLFTKKIIQDYGLKVFGAPDLLPLEPEQMYDVYYHASPAYALELTKQLAEFVK